MVDIPLSDLYTIFASNLPIHASVNLSIEIYFETKNRKLFNMNQPLPAKTTIASELLKLSFEKTPELHIPQFHLTNTYSETLNAGYSMFQDATVVHQFDAKLPQYNISQNVNLLLDIY